MKQMLPWNVTGIPPEVCELARTAAAREGLSVGDWLTRRIVSESSRPAPEPSRDASYTHREQRDFETRRERDDFVHRLAHCEAETESAFRRIDKTMRALCHRLEGSERSQNTATRAMSVAAADINAATREQTQTFGRLAQRIDHVERNADGGAMRDAVRGLHQGLSRLADQVARTASKSSNQANIIAGSLENLAAKISDTRNETGKLAKSVEERFKKISERLGAAEESLTSSSLEETITQLRTRIDSAEASVQEALGHHLAEIERNLETITGRLEQFERSQGELDETIQSGTNNLTQRLEAAEKRSQESLSELRTEFEDVTWRLDSMDGGAPLPAAGATGAAIAATSPGAAGAAIAATSPGAAGAATSPGAAGAAVDSSADAADAPMHPGDDAFSSGDEDSRPKSATQDYLAAARRAAQVAVETDPPHRGRTPMGTARRGSKSRRRRESRALLLAAGTFFLLLIGTAGFLLMWGGEQIATDVDGDQFTADEFDPDNFLFDQLAGEGTGNLDDGAAFGELGGDPLLSAQAPQPAPAEPGIAAATSPPAPGPVLASESSPSMTEPPARPLPRDPTQGAQPAPAPPPAVVSSILGVPPVARPQEVAPVAPTSIDRLMSRARADSPRAATLLGLKYLEGDGVAASDSEAVRWLRLAAEQGEPVAQYRLGTLFERGRGTPADLNQAAFWYEQAAKSGNIKAIHNLAVAYADGSGIPENHAEAARWFRTAAETGLVDSQFNLAVLYERGMGVPASLSDAYKWYLIAANQNDAESRGRVEILATQISLAVRTAVEKDAQNFTPRPMDRYANEPPTLADVNL